MGNKFVEDRSSEEMRTVEQNSRNTTRISGEQSLFRIRYFDKSLYCSGKSGIEQWSLDYKWLGERFPEKSRDIKEERSVNDIERELMRNPKRGGTVVEQPNTIPFLFCILLFILCQMSGEKLIY